MREGEDHTNDDNDSDDLLRMFSQTMIPLALQYSIRHCSIYR